MSTLMTTSPAFDPKKMDQIAALPLGGRVRVDPWSNRLELIKTKPVALNSPGEKMPFEVTPFFPFLTRFSTGSQPAAMATAPAAAPASTTPAAGTPAAGDTAPTAAPASSAPANTTPAVTPPMATPENKPTTDKTAQAPSGQ